MNLDNQGKIRMGKRLRRRRLTWVVLLTVLALAAASCGSDNDSDGSAGSDAAPTDVDPNGIMRIGVGLKLPGGDHFDPTRTAGTLDLVWMQLVEGMLLRSSPDGTLEPMMAKAYKIVDPQTVELTLREGMKFTDGTPFDGEAIKVNLLRSRDAVGLTQRDASVTAIADVTVQTPTSVTVTFKSAVAGSFLSAMASQWGSMVSPKQIAEAPQDIDLNPVGAGPYKIESIVNGESIKVRKNPDYWDAKSWRVAGFDFQDVADENSRVNGLRAGSIDLAMRLLPATAAPITGDPTIGVSSAFVENSSFYMNMCMGKPPFDNEKVRQAVNIGIDRDELNKLVFAGLGEPAYGLWPKAQTAYYEPTLKTTLAYNPTKAKQLLAEAGTPQVSFDLYISSATAPENARIAEGIQGQLAKIGVNATIIAGDLAAQFVRPQKPGAMMVPGTRVGTAKYLGVFGAGQLTALCGVTHPEIVDALAPANALPPGSPSIGKLFRDADRTVANRAYLIPLVFAPRINAYLKGRVGGTPQFDAIQSFPLFDSMYVKRK